MNRAYLKDIFRTIKKNAKRFLAILAITALGLTAFTGITAACRDLYRAADRFYDQQRLFDVRVLSTLGLTDEDVEAIHAVTGVETASGAYSETVHLDVNGQRQSAEMVMLSEQGLNRPWIEDGSMPEKAGEIAVTRKYLEASGKALGDTLTIEEDLNEDDDADEDAADADAPEGSAEPEPEREPEPEPDEPAEEPDASDDDDDGLNTDIDWDAEVEIEEEPETPTFKSTTYTITAMVVDPLDISNNEGTSAFRSTATTDFTFFVTPADVDTEVYTAVYLTLEGLSGLDCYSAAYEDAVNTAIGLIESNIMAQRQQARYDSVMGEALEIITDAEDTMNEKFTEADEQFSDAWADVEEAKRELADGEAELTAEERDALQKLADARAELEDGKAKLRDGEAELDKGEAKLNSQAKAAEKTFAEKQAGLDTARAELSAGVQQLQGILGEHWPEAEWNALVETAAGVAAGLLAATPDIDSTALAQQVGAAVAATQQMADFSAALGMAAGMAGYPGDIAELVASAAEAGIGLGVLDGSQQVLDAGKQTFNKQIAAARKKISDGRAEIAEGWRSLAEGEAELDAEEQKALRELRDAWQELAEGKQELAEGEAELIENEEKYQEKKTEAEEKLADAYAELDDIDMAQWYVQDRGSLDSYSSLDTDLASIGAIGKAFPVLFLVVALLVSLTTMSRLVEEERGLIGTYKALGFGSFAIAWKYLVYALLASLLGGGGRATCSASSLCPSCSSSFSRPST
ncbi:hypothetical protein LJC60_01900 [Ruminococcaceae bacterium OttesenSCG-928-D13]|nr:hypothetical protein [Ruminococcaceae bacterium OttesenSCG-928-D13]